MSGVDSELSREARERRAVVALADYQTKGTPFVLYLRKYDTEIMHGSGDNFEFLDDQLVKALGTDINVVAIQDQTSIVENIQADHLGYGRRALGLRVGDDWQHVVSQLIRHSDMIVQELTLMAEGTRWEMRAIHEQQQNRKTVVVIPAPKDIFATLDANEEIRWFERCIYADMLSRRPLVECPQAADLVHRIRAIAADPGHRRTQPSFEHPGDPPITYDGVVDAMMLEADEAEVELAYGPDEHAQDLIWHVAFWSRYRAAGILQTQVYGWRTVELPAASRQLVTCYLKMAEACGTYYGKRSFRDVKEQADYGHMLLTNAFKTLDQCEAADLRAFAGSIARLYAHLGYPNLPTDVRP